MDPRWDDGDDKLRIPLRLPDMRRLKRHGNTQGGGYEEMSLRAWPSGWIVLAIMDHDRFSADDQLGTVSFSLAELARASYENEDTGARASKDARFVAEGAHSGLVHFRNVEIVLRERVFGTLSGTVEVNLPHPESGTFPRARQQRCEEEGGAHIARAWK